jgi:uncharacterized protein YcbK (DUF882 family)
MALDPNTQLSEHFKASEFVCHDPKDKALPNNFAETIADTVEFLERLRGFMNFWLYKKVGQRFDLGIHIMSGYRNLKYNRRIGSTDSSRHVAGQAADVTPSGGFRRVSYEEFYQMLVLVDRSYSNRPYRIGKYTRAGFVHVDCGYGHGGRRWGR